MSKRAKHITLSLTAIVALLLVLPLMVYVPPVQRFLVDRATALASEATGYDITIGFVSLRPPLTLSLENVVVVGPECSVNCGSAAVKAPAGDTVAVLGRLDASLALWPLFSLRAELGGLTVSDARLNTRDLISDTQVLGSVGRLAVDASTALIDSGTVDISSLLLADADLCVLLSDTAAVDTTTSEPLPWLITLREATIRDTRCELHLPGDSTIIAATLGSVTATTADIDLLHERYALASLLIDRSSLSYDQSSPSSSSVPSFPSSSAASSSAASSPSLVPYAATVSQPSLLDPTHLSFPALSLSLDSLSFDTPSSLLSLLVRHVSFQERCGLRLDDLQATVLLDSLGVRLPSLSLKTPSSSLYAEASLDYAALSPSCPADCGISTVLDASLSPSDLSFFYPLKGHLSWPLSLKAQAQGNRSSLIIDTFSLDLPTVLHAEATGTLALASLLASLSSSQDSSSAPSSSLSAPSTGSSSLRLSLQAQNPSTLLSALSIPQKSFRLPAGLRLDGTLRSDGPLYTAGLTARDASATVTALATLDTTVPGGFSAGAYTADVTVASLDLSRFLPDIPATLHRSSLSARGRGLDPSAPKTFAEATVLLDSLTYGKWQADSILLTATIDGGQTKANVTLNNLYGHAIAAKGMSLGFNGDIKVESNLRNAHKLSGLLHDIVINDSTGTYHPENLGVLLAARPDTTYARIQNGDFIVKLDASGPYDRLLANLNTLADTVSHQLENRIIDQGCLKQNLPAMRIYISSGRENLPARFLRVTRDIDFKELLADITMSPTTGINGQAHLHKLAFGSTVIDTTQVTLKESGHGLTYQARVNNGKKNPLVFTALLDGHVYERGARVGLRLYNKEGRQGLRIGTQATMESDGLRFTLLPKNPTIAFREFTLNDDNFLFLRKDLRLSAKLEMQDSDGTTLDVYSVEPDSLSESPGNLQDLTVSTTNLNLKQLTDIAPFMPTIEGMLSGDFHVIMDQKKQISVAADIDINDLIYEGNSMGNIDTDFVYLQNTDNTHSIDGILLRNGQQVASVAGSYINKKVSGGHEQLDGTLSLVQTPLNMVNGFITDQIAGLEGYANGELTLKGPLSRLVIDGSVSLDSALLFSKPYSVTMAIDDTPITITRSKLTLNNFKLYATDRPVSTKSQTSNPKPQTSNSKSQTNSDTIAYVTLTGSADFSGDGPTSLDLRIRGREMQIINSKQTQGSLLYGQGFVSLMAMVRGTTEKMTVRGRLDVLGTTDLTYLLLDSPLSTDNRMDELVKFTDFSDSTRTITVQRPVPSGMDVSLTVNIDQGAHIRCGLNADQSNYVDIYGGGELRLRMSPTEDMALTGRYTIVSGTMKYSLPVIPLKTFTIQDGSYVEFTGRMDNPALNITATERTRASVAYEGQAGRIVAFDCGVKVTKTLSDMGLQFIISAPEDMTVQSELQSMTTEQQGKLAVTMLTTGMYLADGNTAGFSMNAALSSFLQNEINSIAGNALGTLDISMGIDNTTDASGSMHTDYSFQFAKRFWNNRLKVQIGGKVSSGQEMEGQKQTFFDNVSMEYRLSPTSNQYLKLFYKQNVYDWLDGYTSEYGGGYIYKRKLDHWWDMFRLWSLDNKK